MATATWLYVSLLFSFYGFVIAVTAERLVDVGLSEDHKLVTLGKSMRVVSRASASYADCVNLLDVLSNCHKRRHRAERLAEEVCVETCDDHSDAFVRQSLDNLYVRGNLQHACRRADRC